MAGHSKWSKVKHIKGPLDQKRGQLFSKQVTVAAAAVAAQVVRLIEALEDSDDVQHVHTNFAPTEEALAQLFA